MYQIPADQVAQKTGLTSFQEEVPETILATCPHCTNTPVPFVIAWYLYRPTSTSTYVQTHATGESSCGVCKKQIFLIHLCEQRTDDIEIPSATYMLPEPSTGRTFSDLIKQLSNDFVDIYQQAAKAESMGLSEIAGPGYRKALEFLVKDYLISIEPGDQAAKDELAKRGLHRCITDIGSKKLQAAADAAKLLGNDESHYVKLQGRDLNDLKRLISITIHWLEVELETQALIDSQAQ